METKEAIELLENDQLLDVEIIKKYVALLQQGEALKAENVELKAYKQIVKELKEFYGNGILENEGGIGVQLKNLIEILEQKYLKEVN